MRYNVMITLAVAFLLSVSLPVQAGSQEFPQDAHDVAIAVAAKITAQPVPENIRFAPGVDANIEGAQNGFYAGFDAGKIVSISYENYGVGSTYNADFFGVANLVDRLGRIVALQFLARYTVQGQNITINECYAATASPPTIPLEVYMVPMAKFSEFPEEKRNDWAALYDFARTNTYDPATDKTKKTVYLVMSFVKSRLPDNAQFEAIVSDRKSARREKNSIVRKHDVYLDYEGWRVHMFNSRFSPSSLRERFYINFYYTPGSGVPESERDRTHVGQYDSRPDPATAIAQKASVPAVKLVPSARPAQVPTPKAALAPASEHTGTTDGPLARGMSFLNPIFPEDVALIQQRLKDLGRYGGPIDKTFGPDTKRSLDNFASENGLPKGQWSLGLQKALFKGSGM